MRLAVPAFLLLATCTTACTEHGDARFRDASDAQRRHALLAAVGDDASHADDAVYEMERSRESDPACPIVTTTATGVRYQGPCTNREGLRIEGVLETTSTSSDDETLRFDAFSMVSPSGWREAFDGTVVSHATERSTIDLISDIGRGPIELHLDLRRDDPTHGRSSDGDTVSIDGIGTADVSTAITIDPRAERLTMDVVLRGDDTLSWHLDGVLDREGPGEDCAPMLLDGVDVGALCD